MAATPSCSDGCGVVFKLDPAGKETVQYRFRASPPPASFSPNAGLIGDPAGNLYSTTLGGGARDVGSIFKLDVTGKETVLYSFTAGTDGFYPNGVIRDSAGNLYGTTVYLGNATACAANFPPGCGVVYKLDATGHYTVLYSFTGGADGASPFAGVIRDSAGNLFGTTLHGGITGGACGTSGCGVVFKLKP